MQKLASSQFNQRPPLIGEVVAAAGLITQDQLDVALKEQVQRGLLREYVPIGDILVQFGFVQRERLEAVLVASSQAAHDAVRESAMQQLRDFLGALPDARAS